MSELNARILLPGDAASLLAFEKTRLAAQEPDAMAAEMASWSARWRLESLNHYLPQGWSFACYRGETLEAYILAQPFLFYRGHAQTLWVEHLSYISREGAKLIVDTAHRWARDKHFQCLLFENSGDTRFVLEEWKQATTSEVGWIELKSAKY